MWLVASGVDSAALQNTRITQIRMKLTKKEVGTPCDGNCCVGHTAGGHSFEKCHVAGPPFSW